MRKFLAVTTAAITLSGCGTTFDLTRKHTDDALLLNGAGGDINPVVVAAYVDNQDSYLKLFARSAGVHGAGGGIDLQSLTPDDWKATTNAGVNYVSGQCEDYLHALWELNRARQATNNEIGFANSLVMAILGALKASSASLAITGSAFGFASSTSENLYSSLLYQLEPSSVNSLVHNSQDAVKASIKATMNGGTAPADGGTGEGTVGKATAFGRNDAVAAIRLYLSVCMPQNIEAMVNTAVKNSTAIVLTPAKSAAADGPARPASATSATPAVAGAVTGGAGPLGASDVKINAPVVPVPPPSH